MIVRGRAREHVDRATGGGGERLVSGDADGEVGDAVSGEIVLAVHLVAGEVLDIAATGVTGFLPAPDVPMLLLLSLNWASAAEICRWETSWTECKGSDVARVCQPSKQEGQAPTDAEARHACYEAKAAPAPMGWTKEQVVECTIQCAAGAPLVLPSITLQEGAAPELRAALYKARTALAECVAGPLAPPRQVTVFGNVANGKIRVSRLEGSRPPVSDCLTTALQDTVQAGPDGGTTITLRWPQAPPSP